MCGPIIHLELSQQWEEHLLEHSVCLSTHEHFSLIDLLHVQVSIDGNVGTKPFKQPFFPNEKCCYSQEAKNTTESQEIVE